MSFDIGQTVPCDHTDRYGNIYNTPETINLCPKCGGLEEYYDFVWKVADGNIDLVDDNPLLQELVIKAVLTEKEDNIFHPNYGTSIYASVAAPSTSIEAVARLVEREVAKAVGGVRFRQDQQMQLGQQVTDDELIYSVEGLDLRIVDERSLAITLMVIAESGRSLTIVI